MLPVDTNVWLSAADARSARHAESAAVLVEYQAELVATVPVIAESSWLILDRLGAAAQAKFLRLVTSGELRRVDLTNDDWLRVEELCSQYADLELDAVDASVIAVAERFQLDTIATYNHRDFRVVRPHHMESFQLVP